MASLKHHALRDQPNEKGVFARLFESIAESRMRQVQHEIEPYGVELERLKRDPDDGPPPRGKPVPPH